MLHLRLDWKAPWQPPGSGVIEKGCFYLLMRSVPGAPFLSASVSSHLPRAVKGEGGAAALNACQVTPMPSSLISAPAAKLRSLRAGRAAMFQGGRGYSY